MSSLQQTWTLPVVPEVVIGLKASPQKRSAEKVPLAPFGNSRKSLLQLAPETGVLAVVTGLRKKALPTVGEQTDRHNWFALCFDKDFK